MLHEFVEKIVFERGAEIELSHAGAGNKKKFTGGVFCVFKWCTNCAIPTRLVGEEVCLKLRFCARFALCVMRGAQGDLFLFLGEPGGNGGSFKWEVSSLK
jgi:hypothetical protein